MINSFRYASTAYASTNSVLLDGVNEYIRVSDHATLDMERTDSFSFSGWFYFNDVNGNTMYSKWDNSLTRGIFFGTTGAGLLQLNITHDNSPLERIRVLGTTTLSTATWYHLAFTYDGSSNASGALLYINASDDTNGTPVNDNLANTISVTDNVNIGSYGDGVGNFLDGYADECRFWSKEMTSGEVTSDYNGGCPSDPNVTSLELWLKCGEGDTHPTLTDSSSNSNDGTMLNTEVGDITSTTVC